MIDALERNYTKQINNASAEKQIDVEILRALLVNHVH